MDIKKSYYLLFLVAAFYVGLMFFSETESALDINIHDTYYVIRSGDLYYMLSVFFSILGLLYLLFEKFHFKLFSFFKNIHIYGTLIGGVLIFFYYYKLQLALAPGRYYADSFFDEATNYNLDLIVVFLLIIFLQFLFFINIFVSLIKNLRH